MSRQIFLYMYNFFRMQAAPCHMETWGIPQTGILLEKACLPRRISHQGVVARGEGVVGEEHHWQRLVP